MWVIEVIAVLLGLTMIGLVIYWVGSSPERRQLKVELRQTHINANHQELFLFVSDLLAIHDHGGFTIFPDPDTLARARQITSDYRKEAIR